MSTGNLPGTVTFTEDERRDELKAALEEIFTTKLTAMARQLRNDVREDLRDIMASLSSDFLQRVGSGSSTIKPKRPSRMSSTSTGGQSASSQSPSAIVSERDTFSSKHAKTSGGKGDAPKSEWMMRHRKSFVAGASALGGLQKPSLSKSATTGVASGGMKQKGGENQPTTSHDGHLHVPGRRASRTSSARSPTSNRSPRSPLSPPTIPFEANWHHSPAKHPQGPSESPRPQDLRSNAAANNIHGSPQHLDVEADHSVTGGVHSEAHNGAHSEPRSDGSAAHFGHPLHLNPANHVHGTMSWPVRHTGTESETSCPDKDGHKHGLPHHGYKSDGHCPGHKGEKTPVNCRTLTFEETIRSRETIQSEESHRGPPEPKRICSDEDELEMRDTFAVSFTLNDGNIGRKESHAGGTSSKARLFRGESHVARIGELRGAPMRDHSVHSNCVAKVRHAMSPLVSHEYFDLVAGFLICVHAVLLGLEADDAAARARRGETQELWVQLTAFAFSFWFLLEVVLRMLGHGRDFFLDPEQRQWNIFDLVVVLMHFMEEVVQTTLRLCDVQQVEEVGGLGVLQGFRLVRVVRVIRVVQYMHELRSMLLSVFSTLRSLASALVVLCFLIYMASIYVTQQVAFFGKQHPERVEVGTDLHSYFGSIPRCFISLFQAITNGVDWRDLSDPLTEEISPLMAVVLCAYIAFMTISLLNMITGMFVESALEGSRLQADADIVSKLRDIFLDMGVSEAGLITWQDFKAQMDNPRMVGVFRSIDLDPSEARSLFCLLDLTDSGSIDAEDFVMGCLRLRGPAKSIDLATLMSETRRMNMQWQEQVGSLADSVSSMRRDLQTCNVFAARVSEDFSSLHHR